MRVACNYYSSSRQGLAAAAGSGLPPKGNTAVQDPPLEADLDFKAGLAVLKIDGEDLTSRQLRMTTPHFGNASQVLADFSDGVTAVVRSVWWEVVEKLNVSAPAPAPAAPLVREVKPKRKPRATKMLEQACRSTRSCTS